MGEQEKRDEGLANYRAYGRSDVLFDGYPGYSSLCDWEWASQFSGVSMHELQTAYEQSKREAEQEKQANPALFYAKELLASMEIGDEWYGTSFDQPRWIVQQIITLVEEKRQWMR